MTEKVLMTFKNHSENVVYRLEWPYNRNDYYAIINLIPEKNTNYKFSTFQFLEDGDWEYCPKFTTLYNYRIIPFSSYDCCYTIDSELW